MIGAALLLPILVPALLGLVCLLVPDRLRHGKEAVSLFAAAVNLGVAVSFYGRTETLVYPWAPAWGIDFAFRLYQFSGFILLAAAGFGLLITLYSFSFMKGKPRRGRYYAYLLITLAQVNGAVLADNLAVMLIFWESLLLTLFGFIAIGRASGARGGAIKTAVKAFVIAGITDLCMMLGIIILWSLTKSLSMSTLHVQAGGMADLAFVLLAIGAVSKAGSMPFHSWIPDAALDAPLPFMAYVPAALEKLLGIYFLSRIVLDFFALRPGSWLSTMLMILGAATILLAVLMALIQKDYKKLLSFHAISQVGYMILGIGTAVPAGMIGGIFHMINHAMYKSGLFLSGGSVERQTGTTELSSLGGLAKRMPITFACFLVTAASISGLPPFNGFFSKELVYEGALERGWVYYAIAALGSFFTAASFLKLGHAAYFGKPGEASLKAKEAPWTMLLPMLTIAGFCIFFGLFNPIPIDGIMLPIVRPRFGLDLVEVYSGWPKSALLVSLTLGILWLAGMNHAFGVRRTGTGIGAVDHIHHAPLLRSVYAAAEKGLLDPYNIGLKVVGWFAILCGWIDRGIDWFYEKLVTALARALSSAIRATHTGNYSRYILWSLAGLAVLIVWMSI
jgi:formate hydrogenlyase subunit 3/multisubunit Na+/H+ antiporter MnhD subunit